MLEWAVLPGADRERCGRERGAAGIVPPPLPLPLRERGKDGGGKLSRVGRCSIERRKKLIHELIVERLAADFAVLMGAAKTAHAAATHEENIPDNKYDTLSLEASYVAQGQANRAQELKRALQAYRTLALQDFDDNAPIRLTALVTLEAEDGETKIVFIGPAEGGLRVTLAGEEIMVITPASPLGVELIGKCAGDAVNIGKREFEIAEVC